MFACPSCATPVGASDRSCPACGSGLDIADEPDRNGTPPRSLADSFPGPGANPLERAPPPRRRAVRARHGARGALPHHRAPRPRGNGRGLPGRRPEARPAGRPQVPAARTRRGRRAARPLLPRGPGGPADLAPGGLPRVRRGGGGRPLLPVHGAGGRREPRRRSCGASAACRRTRRSTSRASSAPASPPRTRRASCTGTSSPPTSCSTARATCASPTSAWPASPSRFARRTCGRGRPATCRPSSCRDAR